MAAFRRTHLGALAISPDVKSVLERKAALMGRTMVSLIDEAVMALDPATITPEHRQTRASAHVVVRKRSTLLALRTLSQRTRLPMGLLVEQALLRYGSD